MKLLLSILINGLLILLASKLLSGIYIESYLIAVITAIVLGLINLTVKPIITILTIPVTVLTLGLFLLIINGAMVMLADFFISGFSVKNLGWAILFSLLLAVFNLIIGDNKLFKNKRS